MSRVTSFPASSGCVPGSRGLQAVGATAPKSLPISLSSSSVTARSCLTPSSSPSPSHSRNSDLRATPFRSPGRRLSPVATVRTKARNERGETVAFVKIGGLTSFFSLYLSAFLSLANLFSSHNLLHSPNSAPSPPTRHLTGRSTRSPGSSSG